MKKVLIRLIVAAVVLGAAWSGYRMFQQMPQRQQQVPTARARRGDVVVRSYARGELRAVRSVTLTAPNLFGTVQVTRMAQPGSFARDKDLVVEFDDAEVLSRLEEKQLELDQLDEQLKKAQADLAIRDNQDQVELLRTQYSVRRAELEVKRNELISAIDAKKNLLTLEESKRRLKQLESDIKSRRQQAEAELAVLRERKNKALLEHAREKARLNQVKLLAPMSGLVAIRQARPSFFFSGMQLPDIREGDQVQPGVPVADVLDLSEMEVVARVGELDRANLQEGQEVLIRLDAIPEKVLSGKIKNMSGTASANVFSNDPQKKFDVVFSVDMKQLLSSLGAKPEQIRTILAIAEQNRKKPVPAAGMGMMAGGGPGGGGPGGGMVMMQAGGPGGGGGGRSFFTAGPGGPGGAPGAEGAAGGGRRGGAAAGGGGTQLTEEQQKKFREIMTKELKGRNMQDLSPEDRQSLMAKVREGMQAAGISMPAGGRRPGGGGPGAASGAPGSEAGPGGPGGPGGRRGAGGEGVRIALGGPGSPGGRGGGSAFNERDLANAKLPPPPEQDDQMEVLLRPGLLADVEIIVEKVSDALHIPAQAVREKDGKMIVYLMQGSRFEERPVKLAKRTESTMIIAEGLKEGEIVALGDPNAKPGENKEKTPAGNPMGGMPTGGGGGR